MLKGKVAIVTGGSRGIGYAVVEKFLANGASVVLCASREETAKKAVDQLKKINADYQVEGICPNLSNYDEVEAAFAKVKEKYGKIDILVNNAGISADKKLENYPAEEFKKIMDLNVTAIFNCTKAVVPYMKEAKSGVVLNTSSMVSKFGQPSGCGYPASKFAVNGLTISLARELGAFGIRVNAVAPGVINTDMMKAVPKEYIAPIVKNIPLGRIGEPEDIANAFLFLASDLASYVSGAVLSVDGATLT